MLLIVLWEKYENNEQALIQFSVSKYLFLQINQVQTNSSDSVIKLILLALCGSETFFGLLVSPFFLFSLFSFLFFKTKTFEVD